MHQQLNYPCIQKNMPSMHFEMWNVTCSHYHQMKCLKVPLMLLISLAALHACSVVIYKLLSCCTHLFKLLLCSQPCISFWRKASDEWLHEKVKVVAFCAHLFYSLCSTSRWGSPSWNQPHPSILCISTWSEWPPARQRITKLLVKEFKLNHGTMAPCMYSTAAHTSQPSPRRWSIWPCRPPWWRASPPLWGGPHCRSVAWPLRSVSQRGIFGAAAPEIHNHTLWMKTRSKPQGKGTRWWKKKRCYPQATVRVLVWNRLPGSQRSAAQTGSSAGCTGWCGRNNPGPHPASKTQRYWLHTT